MQGAGGGREPDLGVASGDGQGQIFVEWVVVPTGPEAQSVEPTIGEAMKIAATMEPVEGESPIVAVG